MALCSPTIQTDTNVVFPASCSAASLQRSRSGSPGAEPSLKATFRPNNSPEDLEALTTYHHLKKRGFAFGSKVMYLIVTICWKMTWENYIEWAVDKALSTHLMACRK
jgi:hypothetical protein